MIHIYNISELNNKEITIKQRLRILKTNKAFAVFIHDKLYLVNNLERLFFDRLRSENIYHAEVYELK